MKSLLVIVVGLLMCGYHGSACAQELSWQDIGGGNVGCTSVLINPDNPRIIYLGLRNGITMTEDGGLTWRNSLTIRGPRQGVNFLVFDFRNKNTLYAATGNGLYVSVNQGKNWNRIFRGKDARENECTVAAALPYALFVGTKAGLFVSKDNGRSWHREAGEVGRSPVYAVAYNARKPKEVYVANVDGVFRADDAGTTWERIFLAHPSEKNNDEEEADEGAEDEERCSNIRSVSIDPQNPKCLYIATTRGVYQSQDQGASWNALSRFGLLSGEVRFVLVSDRSSVYAVTTSGIFYYTNARWQEVSFNLMCTDIQFLAQDPKGNLYAACDKGLLKSTVVHSSDDQGNVTRSLSGKDEPKINEVQQAAITYAEVEPEKIMRWRKQAARRAWLPKITVDMDRDRDRTTSNSIWGTYPSSGASGRYFVGPDDETYYKNNNWGVSLSWELGDLIFSDDQTNIDVRSKLMVELRGDILDEVTKVYFERLRVKLELDSLAIEETKKRLEKELKVQELTASLDALTGGYFSQQVKTKLPPS